MKRRHISVIAMALALAATPAPAADASPSDHQPWPSESSARSPVTPSDSRQLSTGAPTGPAVANPPRPAPTMNPAERTFTQKTLFSIPFYLNPRAKQPTDVRLYVSIDRGQNWVMYQQRNPQDGRFDFQASQDGEFWFIVRTNFDRDAPNEQTRPEKVVIVDRTPPLLTLHAEVGRDGEVIASWRATDANLEPRTLRIEYRTTDDEAWQPVMLPPQLSPRGSESDAEFTDEITWMTSATEGEIHIRAQVFDRSLNEANNNASLTLGIPSRTTPAGPTLVDAPDDWQHRGNGHRGDNRSKTASATAATVTTSSRSNRNAAPPTRSTPTESTAVDAEPKSRWTPSHITRWPETEEPNAKSPPTSRFAEEIADDTNRRDDENLGSQNPSGDELPEYTSPADDRVAERDDASPSRRGDDHRERSTPDFDRAAQEVNSDDLGVQRRPLVQSEPLRRSTPKPDTYDENEEQAASSSVDDEPPRSPEAEAETDTETDSTATTTSKDAPNAGSSHESASANNSLPAPVWFNAKRFNLDYEVTDLQNANVARVELWQTRDEGRTWMVHGQDDDLVSPMIVEGLDEGTYGFRLLVTNELGNSPRIPQPGDTPELLVVVDRTRPSVVVDSADVRSTSHGPLVHVRWSTHDDGGLLDNPIEISYAPLPDGPWELIRSELANTGEFVWSPSIALPPKFYLRVDATDRAGNTGSATTAEPVGSAVGPPKAIIRRIQPVRNEDRTERRRPLSTPSDRDLSRLREAP